MTSSCTLRASEEPKRAPIFPHRSTRLSEPPSRTPADRRARVKLSGVRRPKLEILLRMGGLRGFALDLAVRLSKLPQQKRLPCGLRRWNRIERDNEMSETMKALLLRQHGGLENLELF